MIGIITFGNAHTTLIRWNIHFPQMLSDFHIFLCRAPFTLFVESTNDNSHPQQNNPSMTLTFYH